MQNFDINDSQPNSDRPSEKKNSELPEKKPTRNRREGEGERRRSPTVYKRQLAIGGRRSGGEREYRRLMQNALSPRK